MGVPLRRPISLHPRTYVSVDRDSRSSADRCEGTRAQLVTRVGFSSTPADRLSIDSRAARRLASPRVLTV